MMDEELEAAQNQIAARHFYQIRLGDYFVHSRTGEKFVCKAISHRDNGKFERQTILEIERSE